MQKSRIHNVYSLQFDYYTALFLLVVLLVVGIGIQLYPTFNSFFMADDFSWLNFVKGNDEIWRVVSTPSPGGWTTPIPNLIFFLMWKMFGTLPRYYYFTIAFMHLIVGLLVFELVYRLSQEKTFLAFGAALIFSLHFIHFSDWGPLVWISAFVQIVVAVFYLSSLVLFVHYIQGNSIWYLAGSLLCYIFALSSKETAMSLPLLIFVWYLIGFWPLRFNRTKKHLLNDFLIIALYFLILGAYFIYEFSFQLSGKYLSQGLYGIGGHLITNWKYFSNLVIPNPDSPPVQSFLLRTFPPQILQILRYIACLIRICLVFAGAMLFWKGSTFMRLWITFSVITYLPFIGFVEGFAGPNRYFYLPAVGFSVLVAEGLLWIWRKIQQYTTKKTALALFTMGLLVLWGYNMVPPRSWQRQMIENSTVRRSVLELIKEQQVEKDDVSTKVYLEGFPAKFRDLEAAIHMLYGLDTEWVPISNGFMIQPAQNIVVVQYNNGQIMIFTP